MYLISSARVQVSTCLPPAEHSAPEVSKMCCKEQSNHAVTRLPLIIGAFAFSIDAPQVKDLHASECMGNVQSAWLLSMGTRDCYRHSNRNLEFHCS